MIDLNEKQLSNLKAFLERVDLKGAEVPAYIEIMQQLNIPKARLSEEQGEI